MIHYIDNDRGLKADVFIEMANQVWPGSYNTECMQKAIHKTINITAWDHHKLVGCVRLLTDGYLFGTISEILVLKEYQKQGIGKELMRRAIEISPTSLFFGAQPEAEGFYERLKIEKSLQSFYVQKDKHEMK
ncbi:GNAT family N-acetyltransferase [Anaeromassilibacillus senegalensis]|uniref:GNAT family N-acetyltransferase n=1 Tax=Anaeromassilibacillus senegalensis TaxID=1673717 RepID=UPI000AE3CDC2|nr:GNAT family N-acetyltransferase [Anaeromassilibacillus senegalensis]